MPPSGATSLELLDRGQGCWVGRVQTLGMPEAACTDANAAVGICRDVIDDVVGSLGIPTDTARTSRGELVQLQIVADAPGNHVIGARSVAARAHGADNAFLVI